MLTFAMTRLRNWVTRAPRRLARSSAQRMHDHGDGGVSAAAGWPRRTCTELFCFNRIMAGTLRDPASLALGRLFSVRHILQIRAGAPGFMILFVFFVYVYFFTLMFTFTAPFVVGNSINYATLYFYSKNSFTCTIITQIKVVDLLEI